MRKLKQQVSGLNASLSQAESTKHALEDDLRAAKLGQTSAEERTRTLEADLAASEEASKLRSKNSNKMIKDLSAELQHMREMLARSGEDKKRMAVEVESVSRTG